MIVDFEDYEAVFPKSGYTGGLIRQIQHNQKTLGGRTFFERLLELLQIKWRRIYPPSSDNQLQELHKRIVNAPIALHYKHCLLFYLLKDLSPPYHEQTELATTFASQVHLEKRFWTFVEGLWMLDHLQYEAAVGNLTHPSIIPTFPDEIMLVLLHQVGFSRKATENILPMAYYNCANPPLIGHEVKTDFVKYMANRNVTETLYWIRARPEHEQKPLIEALVSQALGHSEDADYTHEEKAMELVSLPLTDDEESWVEIYLTELKGRNLRGALDTVEMRRIATGRLREAAIDGSMKGRKHDQVNWEILRDGVKRGLGPRMAEEPSFGA